MDREDKKWFGKTIGWKIGLRERIRFWEDKWVGDDNLGHNFPRLHFISIDQGKRVGEVRSWIETGWIWSLQWIRNRFEWERVQEEVLISQTNNVNLKRDTHGHGWVNRKEASQLG